MTTDVQHAAKALGDPTRHRIFQHIAAAREPVGVAELTELTGLNHNGVRQHLAVLKEAGLVAEETEQRQRPGRPRLLYRLHPEAAGTWGTSGPYEYLARLLGEAVAEGLSARQVGHRTGLQEATAYDADDETDVAEVAGLIERDLAQRGFRPARDDRRSGPGFVLGRCPFEDVAVDNRDTICDLHLGLAEGLTEGLGGLEVVRLVARNPRRAGCRLALRETDETPDA